MPIHVKQSNKTTAKKHREFFKEAKGLSLHSGDWSRRNEVSTIAQCH